MAVLKSWVDINSGSDHAAGLERMADALQQRLQGLEGRLERIAVPPRSGPDGLRLQAGDALRLSFRREAPVQVLFSGHMDTVFGPEHPFQKWRDLGNGRTGGPGIADMKGGLFILVEAVRQFQQTDQTGAVGGEILITADEEVGSTSSLPLILEASRNNHIGLVFESALPGGELVSARMGTGTFQARAWGRAAHTGRDFQNGRNALVALADFALECHALNQSIPEAIVNVGRMVGGGPVNVVPEHAEIWLNIRIGRPETTAAILTALERIRQKILIRHPDVRIDLEGAFTRAPAVETPATRWLHELWNQGEAQLGLALSGKRSTGGSSDGNILSEAGMPYLDGVGIRGGSIHSSDEFALLDSIPEQIAKTVRFLENLAAHPECIQKPPLAGTHP